MLELLTGVYTGSDMNIETTLNLVIAGLAGEETVSSDNLCWITKTHWPANTPHGSKKFKA